MTHLQRISGDEGDVDDVRAVASHGVNESVLPLQAVPAQRRVDAVEVETQLNGQRRQTISCIGA